VGADHGMEMLTELCAFHLEGKAIVMGIGRQHCSPSRCTHGAEEIDDVGMDGDEVLDLALELHDIETKLLTPVV